jgi:hypothetical protein
MLARCALGGGTPIRFFGDLAVKMLVIIALQTAGVQNQSTDDIPIYRVGREIGPTVSYCLIRA